MLPFNNTGGHRQSRYHRIILTFVAFLGVAGLLLFYLGFRKEPPIVDAKIRSPVSVLAHDIIVGTGGVLADPRFVITSNRPPVYLRHPIPGTAFTNESFRKQEEIRWEFQKPALESHSFPASEPRPVSIHGFLSQCTEMTGVRFAIATNISAGSMIFGHTNILNGAQWATALTEALQKATSEWYDMPTKKVRTENLVLLTRDGTIVLVVPAEMVSEFRKKGFKDFHWKF